QHTDSQQRYSPKKTREKQASLKNDPVPLPRALLKKFSVDHRDRPKPDLISPQTPLPEASPHTGMTRHGSFIPEPHPPVKPPGQSSRGIIDSRASSLPLSASWALPAVCSAKCLLSIVS